MMNDPTKLNNVLNALKNSTKGKLKYPYVVTVEEEVSDDCVLKYIDDHNNVHFSPGFSFGGQATSSTEDEDEDDDDEVLFDEGREEPPELNKSESEANWSLGDLTSYYENMNTHQLELQLEEKFSNTLKISCSKRSQQYKDKLRAIREAADQRLKEVLLHERIARETEEERMVQYQIDIKNNINMKAEEYNRKIEERKTLLMEEVEDAKRREAENIQYKRDLFAEIKNLHVEFSNRISELLNNIEEYKVALDPDVKQTFDATLNEAEIVLHTEEGELSEEQLTSTRSSINSSLDIISSIENYFKARKVAEEEEQTKKQLEQEKLKQEEEENRAREQDKIASTINPADQATQIKQEVENEPVPPQESVQPVTELSPHLIEAETRFKQLQHTLSEVVASAKLVKDDKNLSLPLAKAVGLINQLNNDRQDSNRKLQQIMNLLSGKNCTIGEQSICVNNNPAAIAFVKDQLSSKVINLGHDKQVTSMCVYASLIVKVWQSFPAVGELILFRLYEVCPYLVPRKIELTPNLSSEEYNRLQGYRHKDGGTCEGLDKFLTRMGAAAQLYGRIVAMDVGTQNHPHGLQEGWKWLASILSFPPHKVGTAAAIQGFLSVAGAAMLKFYGKQFSKILVFIFCKYLPILEKETIEGAYSDIATLKRLLETFQKTGNLPPPVEGYKSII